MSDMKFQVFRDPSVKDQEVWRVMYNGRICSPTFNSEGAAMTYLDLLRKGYRKPEYNWE